MRCLISVPSALASDLVQASSALDAAKEQRQDLFTQIQHLKRLKDDADAKLGLMLSQQSSLLDQNQSLVARAEAAELECARLSLQLGDASTNASAAKVLRVLKFWRLSALRQAFFDWVNEWRADREQLRKKNEQVREQQIAAMSQAHQSREEVAKARRMKRFLSFWRGRSLRACWKGWVLTWLKRRTRGHVLGRAGRRRPLAVMRRCWHTWALARVKARVEADRERADLLGQERSLAAQLNAEAKERLQLLVDMQGDTAQRIAERCEEVGRQLSAVVALRLSHARRTVTLQTTRRTAGGALRRWAWVQRCRARQRRLLLRARQRMLASSISRAWVAWATAVDLRRWEVQLDRSRSRTAREGKGWRGRAAGSMCRPLLLVYIRSPHAAASHTAVR